MDPRLNSYVVQEHISDLRRAAGLREHQQTTAPVTHEPQRITLRAGRAEDAEQLSDLAQLDSAKPFEGDVLVALLEDELVAAIGLDDGRVVASPMHPSAEVVALLGLRAAQQRGAPARWRDRVGARLRAA